METPLQVLAHDHRVADSLLEISHAVGSVMEVDDILQQICEIGARVMQTDTCSIYLRDEEDKGMLVLGASKGLSRAQELGVRGFAWGKGLPGWVAANNQTVRVRDIREDWRNAPLDDTPQELRFIAFLCTPLRIQEEVIGVLSIRREHPCDWTDEEALFAEIVAKQAAIVLEKARLYREKIEAERLAAIAISLSGVAHYIKNVLQGISGGMDHLELGLEKGKLDNARIGWGLLKRNVAKIKSLVENMLLFSRQQQLECEPTDVKMLIEMLVEEIQDTAIQHGITLQSDIDENVDEIPMDPEAIHDVLLNLISNAMDAVGDDNGGRVTVRARRDLGKNRLYISVIDNGPGIPEEARKKIFDLFFSTKGRKGTGIGLAVSRKIAREHGGDLRYTTETGKGTTFTVELPAS